MDRRQGEEAKIGNSSDPIEEYETVLSYPNTEVPEAIVYDSWIISEVRDEIHKAGLDNDNRVKKLDGLLLKQLLKVGGADLEESNKEGWWWHLDKIAKKQYPVEKLPEHLRDIYLQY